MSKRQTRRRYLLAVGAVGTATVAGCSGSESDTDGGETDDGAGSTPTGTASATPTAESDSAGGSDGTGDETDEDTGDETDGDAGGDEAAATFRRYLEAYASGDRATVASLTHPESELEVETEEVNLTLSDVERTTLSAIAEAESIELTESELDDARAAIDDDVADSGAEEYVLVSYTAETDQYGEENGYALVVRDDGQWYVFGMVVNYLYGAQ